jgi:2-polyprenyl-3-methyl-5-hydroxy-6-metoxy-1,4-benzoquinol methylase
MLVFECEITQGRQIVVSKKNEIKDEISFEKNHPFFWLFWDYTLGFVLAFWIFLKSMFKIWKSLTFREAIKILFNSKERKNFIRKERDKLRGMKTIFFNQNSPLLQHFCENVTNAAALDDVYNSSYAFRWANGEKIIPLSEKIDPLGQFFLNCPNGQAVRNRCRGVMYEFQEAAKEILKKRREVRVLSIACGSSQAIVNQSSIMVNRGMNKDNFIFTFTDMEQEPLDLARIRAEQGGLSDQVEYIKTHFKNLPEILRGRKFDIIEACGIDDYLPRKNLLELFRFVNLILEKGGVFITSNMKETRGALLLTWTYNWPIIYREPEDLHEVLVEANFQSPKVYLEPWGIHMYATAHKT